MLKSLLGSVFSFFSGMSIQVYLYIFLAALFAGGVLYYKHMKNEIASLEAEKIELQVQLDTALLINEENLKTMARMERDFKNAQAVIKKLRSSSASRDQKFDILTNSFGTLKPEDDGTVSNVLKRTIKTIDDDKRG